MALKCGIVGLPNVGRSTLFNALTNAKALAANYPFATKDPNVGMITVPDERLDQLSELVKPEKVQPTTIEIVDIAGLIKGASQGEGLGNQFLANIRETDAIVHVVRCFQDDNVVHVDGSVDPVRDKEIIDTELLLKDIDAADKRAQKYRKLAKSGKKEDQLMAEVSQRILDHMNEGKPARTFVCEKSEEEELLKELYLLTAKPILYVCNVDEDSIHDGNDMTKAFAEAVKDENAQIILISAGIEADIAEMETKEERLEFLSGSSFKSKWPFSSTSAL